MSCPACFSGHVNDSTPKGREAVLHGLKTYVAEPSSNVQPKGIVVMVPDAFGFPFVNNKIWADHIASAGDFRVYLPDFMDGKAAPVSGIKAMSEMNNPQMGFFTKIIRTFQTMAVLLPFWYANRWSLCWPRITSFLKAVREDDGASLPIGAAGFCWGGLHVIYLAHDEERTVSGKPLVDVVFAAHPSGLSVPSDVEKIQKPVSIAIGDKDFVMPIAQVKEMEKIWSKKLDVETEVKIYKDAEHGFSIRADLNTPNAIEQAEESEKQAVEWFKKQFAKVSY